MSSRLLYVLWLLSILLVVIGSLLPASSPVIRSVGMLPVNDKTLYFCAYTWLGLIALVAVRRRSAAVLAALAMILLGVALEFGRSWYRAGRSKSATCSSTESGSLPVSQSESLAAVASRW
jgi:lysylphosphatidylglycerol synthetase-like protein (DUF2156 family)